MSFTGLMKVAKVCTVLRTEPGPWEEPCTCQLLLPPPIPPGSLHAWLCSAFLPPFCHLCHAKPRVPRASPSLSPGFLLRTPVDSGILGCSAYAHLHSIFFLLPWRVSHVENKACGSDLNVYELCRESPWVIQSVPGKIHPETPWPHHPP